MRGVARIINRRIKELRAQIEQLEAAKGGEWVLFDCDNPETYPPQKHPSSSAYVELMTSSSVYVELMINGEISKGYFYLHIGQGWIAQHFENERGYLCKKNKVYWRLLPGGSE